MPSPQHLQVAQLADPARLAGPWLQDETAFRLEVGRRLRLLRHRRDLTQGELASRAATSRNFVSAVERGAQRPDAWRLWRLAVALEVPPGVLLCQERLPPQPGDPRAY